MQNQRFTIEPYRLKGVFVASHDSRRIFTQNMIPGKSVYGELLLDSQGAEYREWNPKKSKLGAGIAKNISQIGIMPGSKVLYLGCSTGTTCSHVSDIVGKEGIVYGVDMAPRVMREFTFLSEIRENIIPIMADAMHPENYAQDIGKVDIVFQDIAQRMQVAIFLKNCSLFLKNSGYGLLAVKARSIDVTAKPRMLFEEVRRLLEKEMSVVDYRELAPYEKDHCLFIVKKIKNQGTESDSTENAQELEEKLLFETRKKVLPFKTEKTFSMPPKERNNTSSFSNYGQERPRFDRFKKERFENSFSPKPHRKTSYSARPEQENSNPVSTHAFRKPSFSRFKESAYKPSTNYSRSDRPNRPFHSTNSRMSDSRFSNSDRNEKPRFNPYKKKEFGAKPEYSARTTETKSSSHHPKKYSKPYSDKPSDRIGVKKGIGNFRRFGGTGGSSNKPKFSKRR